MILIIIIIVKLKLVKLSEMFYKPTKETISTWKSKSLVDLPRLDLLELDLSIRTLSPLLELSLLSWTEIVMNTEPLLI